MVQKKLLNEREVGQLTVQIFSEDHDISAGAVRIVCTQLQTTLGDEPNDFIDGLVGLILRLSTNKERSMDLVVNYFSKEIELLKDVEVLFGYLKIVLKESMEALNIRRKKVKVILSILASLMHRVNGNIREMSSLSASSIFCHRLVMDSVELTQILFDLDERLLEDFFCLFREFEVHREGVVRFDCAALIDMLEGLQKIYFKSVSMDSRTIWLTRLIEALTRVLRSQVIDEVMPHFNDYKRKFKEEFVAEFANNCGFLGDLNETSYNELIRLPDILLFFEVKEFVNLSKLVKDCIKLGDEAIRKIEDGFKMRNFVVASVKVVKVALIRATDEATESMGLIEEAILMRANVFGYLLGLLKTVRYNDENLRKIKLEVTRTIIELNVILFASNLPNVLRYSSDDEEVKILANFLGSEYANFFVNLALMKEGKKLPNAAEFTDELISIKISELREVSVAFSQAFLLNINLFRNSPLSLLFFELFGCVDLPNAIKMPFTLCLEETLRKETEAYSRLSEDNKIDSNLIVLLYLTKTVLRAFNEECLIRVKKPADSAKIFFAQYSKAMKKLKSSFKDNIYKDQLFFKTFLLNCLQVAFEHIDGKLYNLEMLDIVEVFVKAEFLLAELDYRDLLTLLIRFEKRSTSMEGQRNRIDRLRELLVIKSNLVIIKEEKNEDDNDEEEENEREVDDIVTPIKVKASRKRISLKFKEVAN